MEDRTLLDYLSLNVQSEDEPFCQQYIEQLASLNLSRLSSEPEQLKEKQANLLSLTQSLAFENYRTFIQAAECSEEVYKDFNIIEGHLTAVVKTLPVFKTTVENFAHGSQEINACRRQNSLVLSRHTQLLEILEISQLMDTCVRNGYFEEALELSNYVKRLEKKFSSIKIIADIGLEVKRSTEYMLNQLLLQLKGNIQLPACLRIISYIRQLDVFKEEELRITFLQARDSWFTTVLSQIPNDDAYSHLAKVIDASRVNLFDIITQYKAIFSDDETSYISDSKKCVQYWSILHSWVVRKIAKFIEMLHEDIDRGLGDRLDSIYAQCMYFGLSFSRIRADFRATIVSLFHSYALNRFSISINNATDLFEDEIHTFTISSKNINLDLNRKIVHRDPCIPPHELLDFPPLATFLNHVLIALNNMRQYAALALVFQVKEIMHTHLERIMVMLEKWARLESRSQLNKDTENVPTLCLVVCKYFLPYIDRALNIFFAPQKIQKLIGRVPVNVGNEETKSIYLLDVMRLSNHLKEFVDIDVIKGAINFEESIYYEDDANGSHAIAKFGMDRLDDDTNPDSLSIEGTKHEEE